MTPKKRKCRYGDHPSPDSIQLLVNAQQKLDKKTNNSKEL